MLVSLYFNSPNYCVYQQSILHTIAVDKVQTYIYGLKPLKCAQFGPSGVPVLIQHTPVHIAPSPSIIPLKDIEFDATGNIEARAGTLIDFHFI